MALRIDDLQFEGLKIYQEENGYCFTSDSVLLANYAKFKAGAKVVEFCAGSGVVSILLSKKQKPSVIHAFEVLKRPFEMFEKSVELNKLKGLVVPVNQKLEEAEKILGNGYADVVVCNPPYYKTNIQNGEEATEKQIATTEILTNLESVVNSAFRLLKHGGKLFMVHRVDRLVDVLTTLRLNNLEPKRLNIIYPKQNFEPLVFLVEAHKFGKVGLKVSKATFAEEINKA